MSDAVVPSARRPSVPGWGVVSVLLESVEHPAVLADERLRILAVNRAFVALLSGRPTSQLVGSGLGELLWEENGLALQQECANRLGRFGTWTRELCVRGHNGRQALYRVDATSVSTDDARANYSIVTLRPRAPKNETEEHAAEKFDTATGLPLWRLLRSSLAERLAEAERSRGLVAVILVDVDRVRAINQTLGHAAGRRLLGRVAERLRASLRSEDTVSRLSGDTFGILTSRASTRQQVSEIGEQLGRLVREPFALDGREVFVTGHVGIAVYPDDGCTVDNLLRSAELALSHARQEGLGGFRFYSQEMHVDACRESELESALRYAALRGELELRFQPQVHTETNRIVGAEALVRWTHPTIGQVSPKEFIPVAERAGLIVDIGEWVLKTACHQFRSWLDAGMRLPRLSVNVSSRQLARGIILRTVAETLRETGIDGHRLELEITETTALEQRSDNRATLERLRASGVRIAIDDFGTGYASLDYLRSFPVDAIKLDRSFVEGIPSDPDDMSIVIALMDIANKLKLGVVAEGVQESPQVDFLGRIGCEVLQGFLFSRPLTATAFEDLMTSGGVLRPGELVR